MSWSSPEEVSFLQKSCKKNRFCWLDIVEQYRNSAPIGGASGIRGFLNTYGTCLAIVFKIIAWALLSSLLSTPYLPYLHEHPDSRSAKQGPEHPVLACLPSFVRPNRTELTYARLDLLISFSFFSSRPLPLYPGRWTLTR